MDPMAHPVTHEKQSVARLKSQVACLKLQISDFGTCDL